MRGGYLHNDVLIDRMDTEWGMIGAQTSREAAVTDDQGRTTGYIDLLVRLSSGLIAVEAELTPRRIPRDLEKAETLAVTELWIVVPDVRVRRLVKRRLQRSRATLFSGEVFVLTLGEALQRVNNYYSLFSGSNVLKKKQITIGDTTMEIKWNNLIAFALALFALVVVLKTPNEMGAFLASMQNVGPGYTPQEQTMGLMAYGMVLLAIVALVKIILHNSDKDGD